MIKYFHYLMKGVENKMKTIMKFLESYRKITKQALNSSILVAQPRQF